MSESFEKQYDEVLSDYARVSNQLEAKEKELAAAKADNAMLSEAFSSATIHDQNCYQKYDVHSKACEKKKEALSNSNALDYWQGEVRQASIEATFKALGDAWFEFENEVTALFVTGPSNESADLLNSLVNSCRLAVIKIKNNIIQSNQSKGEKAEGDGDG